MTDPTGKTERQRLEEEREAVLACLDICGVARVNVEKAFAHSTVRRLRLAFSCQLVNHSMPTRSTCTGRKRPPDVGSRFCCEILFRHLSSAAQPENHG